MLNYELLKQEYPDIDTVGYFNASAVSLPPKRTIDAVNSYLPHLASDYCHSFNPYHEKIEKEGREEIAKLIHVDPSEIAFCKNTCDAISQFVTAYPFKEGDNVVLTNQEYPSNFYPWLLQERKGVEVRVVDFHDGELYPEDVLKACDEHTVAVGISFVFFCNGFKFELKELGQKLHEKGILLVVDGIQGLGRLTLRPKEQNIDFLANGGHKCLLGMKGIGFLYCDSKLTPRLQPITACRQSLLRWHRPPLERHASELPWRKDAGIFEAGNPNYIGILAMTKGVSLLNELGPEAVEKHVLQLELDLREAIKDLPLKYNKPSDPKYYSGVLFVTLPEHVTNEQADAVLVKHNCYCTVREGYIRIAIHCMNTEKHVEELVKALFEIAAL